MKIKLNRMMNDDVLRIVVINVLVHGRRCVLFTKVMLHQGLKVKKTQ